MHDEMNRVKRRILDATLTTLAKHKVSGTRMRLIAREAGMSQGNLHYYFPEKAGLFLAVMEDMLEHFTNARAEALQNTKLDAQDKLGIFFEQMKEILQGEKERMFVFYDFWVQGTQDPQVQVKMQNMYATWRADIAAVVQQGVREGAFDPAQAALIPCLMVSLMEGAALQYLIDEQSIDLDEYFARAHKALWGLLGASTPDGG
jgi:TetR/AcrR family transcriptional regulator